MGGILIVKEMRENFSVAIAGGAEQWCGWKAQRKSIWPDVHLMWTTCASIQIIRWVMGNLTESRQELPISVLLYCNNMLQITLPISIDSHQESVCRDRHILGWHLVSIYRGTLYFSKRVSESGISTFDLFMFAGV